MVTIVDRQKKKKSFRSRPDTVAVRADWNAEYKVQHSAGCSVLLKYDQLYNYPRRWQWYSCIAIG